jgi:hypothetical protein
MYIHDARPVLPKICSTDPNGSIGIRGYISVITTLKFTYIFKVKEQYTFKNNRGTSLIEDMYILYDLVYLLKNICVHAERATFILIKIT